VKISPYRPEKADLASLLSDALAKLTGKVGQDGPPNQAAIRNW